MSPVGITLRQRTRKEILTEDDVKLAAAVATDFLREQGARHGSSCTCDVRQGIWCALCESDRPRKKKA